MTGSLTEKKIEIPEPSSKGGGFLLQ